MGDEFFFFKEGWFILEGGELLKRFSHFLKLKRPCKCKTLFFLAKCYAAINTCLRLLVELPSPLLLAIELRRSE